MKYLSRIFIFIFAALLLSAEEIRMYFPQSNTLRLDNVYIKRWNFYKKEANDYKTISKCSLDYAIHKTNNIYYGYDLMHEDKYDRHTLWCSSFTLSNDTINILNSNKFVILSSKWFEGFNLKHSISDYKCSSGWYHDLNNTYLILCYRMGKSRYGPNFRRPCWEINYDIPVIMKFVINRSNKKVISHKIIEYPYSLDDWYKDVYYMPVPEPFGITNYMIVTNKKNGYDQPPDIEVVGLLDNGKVFMQEPIIKKYDRVLGLRINWLTDKTYLLNFNDWRYGNIDMFKGKNILSVKGLTFLNVNADIPIGFIRKDECFYKNNVVLAGTIDGIVTVIKLRYENNKIKEKNLWNFSGYKYEKVDLRCIQKDNNNIDIVLINDNADEKNGDKWKIIKTVKVE